VNGGVGDWLSRDPIEEQDGPNVYAFIKNNTPNDLDQLGMATIYAAPDQNIASSIQDFFSGGGNTWLFEYPHPVALRFESHYAVAGVFDAYRDAKTYCESGQGGTHTEMIDYQFTAPLQDFESDVPSFLGFWTEGFKNHDFGVSSFGSFHVSGELEIDCCKHQKSLHLAIFNRWSISSLTRNPVTGVPFASSPILRPVDEYVIYNLTDSL
jgi:hypothetical protein